MRKTPYTPTTYKKAFVQRVRAARLSSGKDPAEMAALLSVPKDTYFRYETRTLLPLNLVPLFCQITSHSVQWLITGQDDNPLRQPDDEAARKLA